MQDSSNMWDVRHLCETYKGCMPGFDYRIKFSADEGRPMGVVWMTKKMRFHLLHYGDIIFLDAQKRCINELNWGYIAPAIKDSEYRTGVAAESILLEESFEFYIFVLSSMVEIEPRFRLRHIKFIYGDLGITEGLLEAIGISETCILRWDHWHLSDAIWPRELGEYHFGLVQGNLRGMLNALTREAYEGHWEQICAKLCSWPDKISYLQKFYEQPQRIARYTLQEMEGCIGEVSSVTAEQNHSSVIAAVGKESTNLSLTEHITRLMERQRVLGNRVDRFDSDYHVECVNYCSNSTTDPHGDYEAKQKLSKHAFVKYYQQVIKTAQYWEVRQAAGHVEVFRPGQELDSVIQFPIGQRCPCPK
jgi:hypothetical protein